MFWYVTCVYIHKLYVILFCIFPNFIKIVLYISFPRFLFFWPNTMFFEVYPYGYMLFDFVHFNFSITCHCMNMSPFVYPFYCWWTFRLCLVFCFYKLDTGNIFFLQEQEFFYRVWVLYCGLSMSLSKKILLNFLQRTLTNLYLHHKCEFHCTISMPTLGIINLFYFCLSDEYKVLHNYGFHLHLLDDL